MAQLRLPRLVGLTFLAALFLAPARPAVGDKVVLKNGIVYRGTVDRDNTIVWIFDGLKRVVIRDSKIARIEPDNAFGNWESFKLVQPLVQHAGVMPKEAVVVKTTPWNDRGRRSFSYVGSRSKRPVSMEQAIYELGPYLIKLRGVDGFWQEGRMSTRQVPREVVLGLLAKVDRTNQNERRRVASFLIQAEWYTEAKRALEAMARDFPDDAGLRDTVQNARAAVSQLEAVQLKADLDVRRKGQQYHEVMARLKTFPSKDVSAELLVEVRDLLRKDEAQAAADKALADGLRALGERLPTAARKSWKAPLLEVLQALAEAPDAVRDRLLAWQKAKLDSSGGDEAQFALAMSGYVVGADAAVADLAAATTLWQARDLVHGYLATLDATTRGGLLERLEALEFAAEAKPAPATQPLDIVSRLAVRAAPPLLGDNATAGTSKIHRVHDDENETPTEYTVLLPPEYHPLRSYPAVVALHDGNGPQSAIDWWADEAARRGYIVVAPEYNLPDQPKDYRYSTSEHAAVELALRDARRRYAIDGDRVFVGGQLLGGNMAWDFGLAHPDLFAGAVVISGFPLKYVYPYSAHVEKLPLYVALGDLAPASSELVFGQLLKPLIAKAYDVTYVEHYRRPLEDLPEEAPAVFDWMDRRRREPYPKVFKAFSARESDVRFYGVVIREFLAGHTTAPEAADPFGKNLHPASIEMTAVSTSNLLKIRTTGIKRLDVWVSPRLIDFKRKLEVRINGKTFLKEAAKPDLEALLEDLRIRGDRQQLYWLKVSAG